jgi:hypothetical protein
VSAPKPGRDLRLDLFRGVALVFIFLNHIPNNVVSWISNRNYGFCDATEIFVFISGYSAALAYGGAMRRAGFPAAAARILKRCWQVYVAQILLFVIFTAHIAWVAERYANPMYAEEMLIVSFLDEPHIVLAQALLLKFNPANMDVLPLYVILLLGFPPVLKALLVRPHATLAASALLYATAHLLDWNLPSYPSGHWFFNPFAWQLLFVFGGWCACGHAGPVTRRIAPALDVLATAMLLFGLWFAATWHLPQLEWTVPVALRQAIYPIDKTGLDPLRIAHFLALAWLAARLVRRDSPGLAAPIWRPLRLCGRQSLHVFCVGVMLSFIAHWLLIEVNGSLTAQLGLSLAGFAILLGVAAFVEWYRSLEARPERPRLPAAAE